MPLFEKLTQEEAACRVIISDISEQKLMAEKKALIEARLHQAQRMESIGRLAGRRGARFQ